MKRNIKLLIIIIILAIIAIILYNFAFSKNSTPKLEDFSGIQSYIKDIYGQTFLIPEFDDINEADEDWLWENVNQYIWNHDDEYHEKNEQEYGYSYEDVSKIVKTLYGNSLNKKFPKGAVSMRYDHYRELYGPTAFSITNYYNYIIEKIIREGNIYTISLYDFVISSEGLSDEDSDNGTFKIFNNYEYLLSGENAEPIIQVKTLNDDKFNNLLNQKEKLSHKTLKIEYNQADNLYYIKSCKYEDTKESDILATMYDKVRSSFEIMSIDYNYEDIYTQDEVLVNNFDELSSIYTENSIQTYKDEMDIFVYKDNGEVYITAGDITVEDYLVKIELKDIQKSKDKISCTVVRTFRNSFDPADEEYNQTYQKEDSFSIVKIDGKWFVDEFSYNN